MIFRDFLRAVAQVEDPRFLRVFLLGLAGTVALLFVCFGLALGLIEAVSPDRLHLPGVGEVTWVGDLLHWGSLLLMIGLSVILMVPVASAVTAFFLDDVVDAVEARHYPQLPAPKRQGFWGGLRETIGYFALLLTVNALLLPAYVVFPPSVPFLFYGVNGLLLAREYFNLVALRRLPKARVKALRRRHWLSIWLAGVFMALPLSIPLVNLTVPILGAATFCHLYHRLMAAEARSIFSPAAGR